MHLLRRCLLLVVLVLLVGRCSASSSHSLRYLYTAISERGHDSTQFSALAYVDDQVFSRFDTDTMQCVPQSPWVEEISRDDTLFWDKSNRGNFKKHLTVDLGVLKNLYNQSQGLHVLQVSVGCELTKDDHATGFMKYGYNGRDFLSLNQETLTWTALEAEAKLIKQKWDAELSRGKYWKFYVQETCVDRLRIHLHYGKAALQRTETPMVNVMRRTAPDGLETLVCRVYGFYPKEIEVTWMKDGMQEQETFTGGVTPNSDGTYHTWLTIEVDPEDRGRYRCHVEHDALPDPLDVAWEDPGSSRLILGVLLGVVAAAVLLGVSVTIYMRKCREGYKEASASEQESDSNAEA